LGKIFWPGVFEAMVNPLLKWLHSVPDEAGDYSNSI